MADPTDKNAPPAATTTPPKVDGPATESNTAAAAAAGSAATPAATPASSTPPPDAATTDALKELDEVLSASDPEFAQEMASVQAVGPAEGVEIESLSVGDDEFAGDAAMEDKRKKSLFERFPKLRFLQKPLNALKTKAARLKLRLRARLIVIGRAAVIFIKTRPKEFVFYILAMIKALMVLISAQINRFRDLSFAQKLLVLIFAGMLAASLGLLYYNTKGIWVPAINKPILLSFADVAEQTFTMAENENMVALYQAFPQPRHDFLFRKFKVNLARTADYANPMGAFEIFVVVDSKEAAIELRERQTELHDSVQRIMESQSYNDLDTRLGKERLKGLIKKELDSVLNQGWVKDVHFNLFVIKP